MSGFRLPARLLGAEEANLEGYEKGPNSLAQLLLSSLIGWQVAHPLARHGPTAGAASWAAYNVREGRGRQVKTGQAPP